MAARSALATPLAEFAWSHDAIGNVTTQSEKWFGAVDPARSTTTARITAMTYDGANRLETEIISDPVSGVTNTTYSYDHANNRSSKTVTGGTEPGHWTYTYNKSNQLTAWEKRASDAVGAAMVRSTTLTYDDNGNRLNQTATGTAESGGVSPPNVANDQTSYTWDTSNRLASVLMPDGKKFDYTYDYRMRRVGTVASGTAPAKHTAIVFSGGLSVAEYEGTAIQPPVPTGPPLVQYRRGPDMGGGVGGMLYSLRASGSSGPPTVKYSLSNGRGDIVAQSDEAAALTWTASYEAHGRRTTETGTNDDKQRANSKDEDPTGLLNEGFRYRDLETGVWLSRDPAGFVDGPNLYAYVKQNPWTAFDPKGLSLTVPDREASKTQSYIEKQGVAGHSVSRDTTSWYFKNDTVVSGGLTKSAKHTGTIAGEIVSTIINSDHNFKFGSAEDFERHVNARLKAVDIAKNKIKAKYSMGRDKQVFGKHATKDEKKRFAVKPGSTLEQAVESTLTDENCVIDCVKGAHYPLVLGMLSQGDQVDMSEAAHGFGGTSRRTASADTNDWIPGDWGYLRNFSGIIGENILYLGNQEWVGHNNPRSFLDLSFMAPRADINPIRIYPQTGLLK